VRPPMDAVGRDPSRQRESGRGFLGLRGEPLRALPGADGSTGVRSAPCRHPCRLILRARWIAIRFSSTNASKFDIVNQLNGLSYYVTSQCEILECTSCGRRVAVVNLC